MKTLFFLIVTTLIPCIGLSVENPKQIRISPDIELIRLSKNAYLHISYAEMEGFGRFGSNGLVYINNGEALLFDTPMTESLTKELVTWLVDSMKVKITGFVPNHWHNDCMGGLAFLQSLGIKSYANQMTIEIARSKDLPVPDSGFTSSLQLTLGDKTVYCYYLGPAHSMDNIVIWLPSEQILFAGCMIKSLDSKGLGNTVDGDLAAYPYTIDRVLEKFPNARIVIPGHGEFGGIELITHTKELAEN
jgi:metallo-beta-lactamase class B